MDETVDAIYASSGRSSVPPESLLKATVLMATYSLRLPMGVTRGSGNGALAAPGHVDRSGPHLAASPLIDAIAIDDLHGAGDCSRLGRPHLDDRAMRQGLFERILRVESQQRSQQHAADHLVRHDHRRDGTCRRYRVERCLGANIGVRVALPAGE